MNLLALNEIEERSFVSIHHIKKNAYFFSFHYDLINKRYPLKVLYLQSTIFNAEYNILANPEYI